MLTFLNWLFPLCTVLVALLQYLTAGEQKTSSRSAKYTRLGVVVLSLATLASFYGDSLERNKHLEQIINSIQRSLDKIEYASASFQGTVPASDPDVAEFRSRITADPTCLESTNGFSQPITADCLTLLRKDQTAYRRLGAVDIQLDFQRDSVDVELSIGFAANLAEGSLNLSYDAFGDRFVLLTSKALEPYSFEAPTPGDILSIDDLENAVLEIRVKPAELRVTSGQERLVFESIDLKFKGAHTWYKHIERKDTEQIREPPYPVFRYSIRR